MPIDVQDSTPLYLQIIDDIKSKIAARQLKAGDQIGSHAELTSKYGVSLITVKKALTTLVQQGVLYSRVGKGTYVAQLSPDTHDEQHPTIGLVLQDIRSPFFSRHVMHSVEHGAYELGYHVLLGNSSGKPEKEDAQVARFRTFGVKVMIIASMSHEYHASPTIRKLSQEGFPFVMVSYIADENIPFVGCDHEQGGYMATEYLIKLGYQRIGYINGEKGNLVGALRERGFAAALKAHGKKVDKRFLFRLRHKGERYNYQAGYEIGGKFAKLNVRPDAMFIYNDLSALGFEDAVLAVAVVGSVYTPNALIYRPEKRLGDYLDQTGGPTGDADSSSLYVLRADGSVTSKRQTSWVGGGFRSETVMPGDTIVVPEDLDKYAFTRQAKDWAQIFYQLFLGVAGLAAIDDLIN